MPEPKRPLKVFLCHAHADRDAVRALYTRLTKDGVDAWLDKEKLLGGEDWEYEIRNAVRESDIVIVCHSKQFNQKGFRQKEVKIALEEADLLPKGEIFIIPVRLEECDVLDDLKRWHWVDLFESDGYERLLRALRVQASRIGATLQIKKSRLPKITTLRPSEEKKTVISDKDLSELNREEIKRENAEESARKKEVTEKAARKAEEDEKEIQRMLEKSIKKAKRDLWWEKFKIDIRYRFRVIYIYRVPILILLATFAIATPIVFRLSNLVPEIITTFNTVPTATVSLTLAPQSIINSTETFIPLETLTPSLTSTEVLVETPTSLPTEVTDAKGVSMALVIEGDFVMGDNSFGGSDKETPPHTVELKTYYIDKYEVTNMLYKVCEDAGVCVAPLMHNFRYLVNYYDNPEFGNYPVVNVNWDKAKTYCDWRGARLPTEAEWEKAARGNDGRNFPWGNDFEGHNVNFCDSSCYLGSTESMYVSDGFQEVAPVGTYENGRSPYGVYDMAGNVSEWVADWYSETYYRDSPLQNPLGPSSGNYHIKRGGSWRSARYDIRVFDRAYEKVDTASYDLGFRCARDATP